VESKTIKILFKNKRIFSWPLNGICFLIGTQKAPSIKESKDKLYYIKTVIGSSKTIIKTEKTSNITGGFLQYTVLM
jgi:hypothetical protein